jgi:hypothetical protein
MNKQLFLLKKVFFLQKETKFPILHKKKICELSILMVITLSIKTVTTKREIFTTYEQNTLQILFGCSNESCLFVK